MNKILKIILIVIVLLIILTIGFVGYFFLQREYKISKLSDYYQDLAKDCKKKESFSCCMASVENMAENNYKLMPETGCPKGFQKNLLKCIDSYTWCEPVE